MYFETTNNLFLISVMAGSSLTGLGLGLVISRNGSSGGMDIPVIILAGNTLSLIPRLLLFLVMA